MSPRRWIVLALVLVCGGGGCAKGITGGKKYTRFQPDGSEHIETVRQSGDHFIVVRMIGADGLARWPDTKRELRAGDRIGFTRDERGNLMAVAGNATRCLEPVPTGIAYLAWYYRKDRPLHGFAHDVRDGAGRVAGLAAEAAIIGGVVIGTSMLEDALDTDDDDDDPEWLARQRKRDR